MAGILLGEGQYDEAALAVEQAAARIGDGDLEGNLLLGKYRAELKRHANPR